MCPFLCGEMARLTLMSAGHASRATLLALAMALCIATDAVAQSATGEVIGVVTDSVAGAPLGGAHVQLVPESGPGARPLAVDADSAGSFRITNVPPGRYLLAIEHPRLDALGVEVPPLRVEVTGGAPVRVSPGLPGPRTLGRLLCGAQPDSFGAIVGRVLDAEQEIAVPAGTAVVASWAEIRFGGGRPARVPIVRRVATDENGRFALCGLPSDVPVLVQAASASLASGEIELQVPRDGALARDLLVAAVRAVPASAASRIRGSSRLSGHVRRPEGQPISGVQVIVLGTGASATTNEAGRFELDSIPAGTRTVEARALGYVPARVVVDLAARRAATAELTLAAQTPMLEAVTVYGRAPARADAAGFVERSHGAFGHFITAKQIARDGGMSVLDVLRMVPGLRVTQAAGSLMSTVLSRGETFDTPCMPAIFLDGAFIPEGAMSLDNLIRPSDVGGIEVYVDGNTAPAQYDRGGCGSIVIWSRAVLPR